MKSLKESLYESTKIITESFSEALNEYADILISSKVFKRDLSRELTWDKIATEDVQEMTPAEASKDVYKRSGGENEYLLWFMNDILVARSIGLDVLRTDVPNNNPTYTIKKLSSICDKVLRIKNIDKYSTSELRKQRRLAKQNALALKSDLQIQQDNIKKYYDMLISIKVENLDIYAKANAIGNKFGELLNMINKTKEAYTSMYNYVTVFENPFNRLMEAFENLQSYIRLIVSTDNFEAEWKNDIEHRKEFNSLLNDFENEYNKFIAISNIDELMEEE